MKNGTKLKRLSCHIATVVAYLRRNRCQKTIIFYVLLRDLDIRHWSTRHSVIRQVKKRAKLKRLSCHIATSATYLRWLNIITMDIDDHFMDTTRRAYYQST